MQELLRLRRCSRSGVAGSAGRCQGDPKPREGCAVFAPSAASSPAQQPLPIRGKACGCPCVWVPQQIPRVPQQKQVQENLNRPQHIFPLSRNPQLGNLPSLQGAQQERTLKYLSKATQGLHSALGSV